MPRYYDDLSADSSSSDDDEDDEEEDVMDRNGIDQVQGRNKGKKRPFEELDRDFVVKAQPKEDNRSMQAENHRIVLHLDVDCFYCQCESIERKLPPDRPFAIGQKHIIVTCNYEARKYGVTKLQLRTEAYRACPSLVIFEGSDLERYRIASRRIYEAFRKSCQSVANGMAVNIPVHKLSMDEMVAEFTSLDQAILSTQQSAADQLNDECYVYGDTAASDRIVLTEDQTGATTVVDSSSRKEEKSTAFVFDSMQQKLLKAFVPHALRIRRDILDETAFTTTLGLSVNPFLAKLSSGLKKPATVNLLYPWRSGPLLSAMPLRKVTGLGRRMMKAVTPCLEKEFPRRGKDTVWTCSNLLQLPVTIVRNAFRGLPGDIPNQADRVMDLCRGIDSTPVEDDHGGLPKTLSVENSFRRGTVLSVPAIHQGLEDLYTRLPRLLAERQGWSHNPKQSYPLTLRLTIRFCLNLSEPEIQNRIAATPRAQRSIHRRPFVTHSKQTSIAGKALVQECRAYGQEVLLRKWVAPLLRSLLEQHAASTTDGAINVTRINIALDRFQDVQSDMLLSPSCCWFGPSQQEEEEESPPRVACSTVTVATQAASQTGRVKSRHNTTVPKQTKITTWAGSKSNFKSSTQLVAPAAGLSSHGQKRKRIDQYFLPAKRK